MYTLHRRGAARTAPAEAGFSPCVDFHRKKLERQRDLLRSVWSRNLLPFIPGLIVFLCGMFAMALEQPNASAHASALVVTFAVTVVGCAALLLGTGMLNRRAARKLQHEMDALDGLEKES